MSSRSSNLPESNQELAKIIDTLTTRNEQLEAKVRWFEINSFICHGTSNSEHPENGTLKNNPICLMKLR